MSLGTMDLSMSWVVAIVMILVIGFVVVAARQGKYQYKAQKIMTGNELEFFLRLVRSNPDGYVFPQIAMSALIAPTSTRPKTRLAAFRAISQKRIDYAIYTKNMKLLCVVELDDKLHNAKADALRDGILESAGLITVRWNSKRKPTESEIKAKFNQLQFPEINKS